MDSPALNPHSRLVLAPLAPARLPPSVINIPGPGPVESHSSNFIDEPPPPPPASEKRLPLPRANGTQEEETTEEGDAGSDQETAAPKENDPYANLGGAFGNYLADEPRPMAAAAGRGRNDLDDLLF